MDNENQPLYWLMNTNSTAIIHSSAIPTKIEGIMGWIIQLENKKPILKLLSTVIRIYKVWDNPENYFNYNSVVDMRVTWETQYKSEEIFSHDEVTDDWLDGWNEAKEFRQIQSTLLMDLYLNSRNK